ncbi:hypothetical protein P5F14_15390 [Clostridium perfringens]|uniref:hypothetical protein n=1 Tax=Clostridium perfringens TaxID=1502 RepID=UPI0032DB0814|nr:hypothetical protein [Clostridium perfringens]
MKKILVLLSVTLLLAVTVMGCGSKTENIKMPDLDKEISSGELGNIFDYSTYEETIKGDKKNIKITLAYNGDVLRVGTITGIRNIIERDLSSKYNEIDLTIIQEKPEFSSVNYIFQDGKWDKDVE